jgi:hypothetical protein
MPNALQEAGALSEPTNFAPLHTNRIFTGLWTNRSLLRDAATNDYQEHFGMGRQDSILGGQNSEISPKLTLLRRAGTSVYNKNSIPPVKRFYSWNTFTLTDEATKVLADTASAVYDVTGANDGTGNGANTAVWSKAAGAGPTYFLGVGNTLLFTNGKENKQWTIPLGRWTANTTYHAGDRILDPNGNQWLCAGFYPNKITQAQVQSTQGGNVATITATSNVTGTMVPGALYGTSVTAMNRVVFQPSQLNGAIVTWSNLPSNVPTFAAANIGGYYVSVASAGGTSGATAPTWSGTYVTDNIVLWVNQGPTIADWGIQAPITQPNVSQTTKPNPYPSWTASTAYCVNTAGGGFLAIIDDNSNVQVLKVTAGLVNIGATGNSKPTPWGTTSGAATTDGTLTWNCAGSGAWVANGSVSAYQVIVVTVGSQQMFFQNQTSGGVYTSGPTPPIWPAAIGATIGDGPNVVWMNVGLTLQWSTLGAKCPVLFNPTILDPNGYLQNVLQPGKSSAAGSEPSFKTSLGAVTTDATVSWSNAGAFAVAGTAPVTYGYEYMNSVTVDLSNMSPPSIAITANVGDNIIVQGPGSADTQVDTIVIFRTVQGGSTYGEIGQVPNPGAGQTWSFTDTTTDAAVNIEWQAQRGGEGTPLPIGATCLGYHVGRIFAAVGNVVWVSSGPDATVGGSSGNAGFDIQLVAQSKITRFWACSLGMVVFTVRDAYIILGSGTDTDPLYMVVFIENLPLRSYDCFTVNKTTPYLLMANNQLVALDPSAGIVESGFPIADMLMNEYDSSASYVTFHSQSSLDSALYVANGAVVPPGSTTSSATGQWYRMAQNNAPESGSAWSTKAILAGGTMGCVQSVEVTPGVYRLLISGTTTGPIWQRDSTKNTDNGNAFPVQTFFGNIVLALPGQLAALSFITLESVKTGTRAGLALLLGEVSGTFETLNRTRQDPPILPPSNTLYSDRYHFAQNQNEAWCRHFQMEVSWPAEDAANELLTFTIFGQTWQEMRSQ